MHNMGFHGLLKKCTLECRWKANPGLEFYLTKIMVHERWLIFTINSLFIPYFLAAPLRVGCTCRFAHSFVRAFVSNALFSETLHQILFKLHNNMYTCYRKKPMVLHFRKIIKFFRFTDFYVKKCCFSKFFI